MRFNPVPWFSITTVDPGSPWPWMVPVMFDCAFTVPAKHMPSAIVSALRLSPRAKVWLANLSEFP